MNCRHCAAPVSLSLIDLGSAPYSNAYLTAERLHAPEKWYPLRVLTCTRCWLTQTDELSDRSEIFSADYAYFTSYSTTALAHAEQYVGYVTDRFQLGPHSHVVEVASNDGYLLQYVQARGIPCVGVEPTASTARAAVDKGIDVIEEFFGVELGERVAAERGQADLAVANNVLVHVPDINDFVGGFARVLKPSGVVTFEFPHLVRLVQDNLFDTIYHEHYSYLSFTTTVTILGHNGLEVFDVEQLPTHGGSLRVYAQRRAGGTRPVDPRVHALLAEEAALGVTTGEFYRQFQTRAERVKDDFLLFLVEAKRAGKRVAGYGAAAKANTFMNFAGIRGDLVSFVADRNPAKSGKFMPGSRIPIGDEARLKAERPDFVVLFPWNLRKELSEQLHYVRDWGGQFVTAIPHLTIA